MPHFEISVMKLPLFCPNKFKISALKCKDLVSQSSDCNQSCSFPILPPSHDDSMAVLAGNHFKINIQILEIDLAK